MAHSLNELSRTILVCIQNRKMQEAYDVCCIALKDEKAGLEIKQYFSLVADSKAILSFNPVVKNAIRCCLETDGVDHQKLSIKWGDVFLYDPNFSSAIQHAQSMGDLDKDYWEKWHEVLSDPYFLLGLRQCIIQDQVIEQFITSLRRLFLLHLWPSKMLKTKNLDLICAFATQGFNNEYSYFVEKDEEQAVAALPLNDPIAVSLRACYESLRGKKDLQKLSAAKPYRDMMETHVKDPEREAEIKKDISTLVPIDNKISETVQAQYEDNPYPRWLSIGTPQPNTAKTNTGKTLIAACGTGLFTTQQAIYFPKTKLTAVDISRTSIAYAKRKVEEYGAANVDFFQCDILNLGALEETYDFINCTGVLHHMENPVEGWKKLVERLAPGGGMLIGLYSTRARKIIHELRGYVKEKGYAPDLQGIRAFRKDIMDLPNGHPHKSITNFKDFYTSSDVRDLIFHVQETTYTLPEIKEILDLLGLEFIFMKMPNAKLMAMFNEKFGADAKSNDLGQWDELEQERPYIFGEMYNFLCVRKGETLNAAMRSIVDSGFIGP